MIRDTDIVCVDGVVGISIDSLTDMLHLVKECIQTLCLGHTVVSVVKGLIRIVDRMFEAL